MQLFDVAGGSDPIARPNPGSSRRGPTACGQQHAYAYASPAGRGRWRAVFIQLQHGLGLGLAEVGRDRDARAITSEMTENLSRNQKKRKVEVRGEGRNNCTCENAESVRLKRNTNRHPHPTATGREAGRRRSGKSKNRTEINKKSLVYNGVLSQTGHGRLSASRTGPTVSIHARAPRPALGWETRRGARLCVYTALGSNLRLAPPPALEATHKGRDGKKKTSSPLAGKRGSGKYKTWAS
jgi:hypothetical protein